MALGLRATVLALLLASSVAYNATHDGPANWLDITLSPTDAAGAKPVVSKLSRASGPSAGGTRITITGKHLRHAVGVLFGATPGTALRVRSARSLQVTTPSHPAGRVSVRVVTAAGRSKEVKADRFRFAKSASTCGTVNMAVGPMAGAAANTYVAGNVLESLGCTVVYQKISQVEVEWAAMANNGEISVVMDDWPDPRYDRFLDGDRAVPVTGLGPTGNTGGGGWYVPPWLGAAHPDILDWQNLDSYADQFATDTSGGKGRFLDMVPGQLDSSIIDHLGLDFQVAYSGSEAGTVSAFQEAEANHEFLLGYFYEPHWLFRDLDLQRVSLPAYTDGCQDQTATVACDYQQSRIRKVAATVWVDQGGPGVRMVKKFHWSNADQELVEKYIDVNHMAPEDAAAKWVADNPDQVDAWLS